MATFNSGHSLYGRQLHVGSTGGLVSAFSSSGGKSTAFNMAYQAWGDAMVATTTSTGGATLSNSGVSVINTSATAATFLLKAPVTGVEKEVYIISSASALTFGCTSTSQVFMKVGGGSAGSTTLTLTDANLAGQTLVLRGLSATRWGVSNGSTVIQA